MQVHECECKILSLGADCATSTMPVEKGELLAVAGPLRNDIPIRGATI